MAEVTIDTSALPVIKVILPTEGTPEDIRKYYARLEIIMRQQERLAFLVDLRQINILKATAEIRAAMATEFKKVKPLFEEVAVAQAHLVEGTMTKGVLTAFNWLLGEKVRCPEKVFDQEQDALDWLNEHLDPA